MTVEEFDAVLQKIQNYTDFLYLHVKGEPLLHPFLSEILDLCHLHQMHVVLVTNGTLLEKNGSMLLSKKAVCQINISLHCYSELPGDKEKSDYIQTILRFTRKALNESGIVISLRFWNANMESRESVELNSVLFNTIEREFAPSTNLALNVKPGNGIKLGEKLWLNSDYEFTWPSLDMPETRPYGTCRGLRDQVAILCDGTIVPCCIDAEGIINLGNIHESTMAGILELPRTKNIISGFLKAQRTESLCRRCDFY